MSTQRLVYNVHGDIIHNSSKAEATEMSVDCLIHQQDRLHPSMEYHLAIKGNEAPIRATEGIDFETFC